MTNVTMHDIARYAGVSQSTVSLVLNKKQVRARGSITEETQQRVLDAAKALNYRTNKLAKSMVTGKNRIIGVLMTPSGGEFSIRVLTGANHVADEHGYLQKILHLDYENINESVVARCQEWRLAGVMVFGFSEEDQAFLHDEFARIGMPVAMIDNTPPKAQWGARIRSDDAQGISLAVFHLRQLGHERIGFVGGDSSYISRWREEIFRNELTTMGLPVRPDWIKQASWGEQSKIEKVVHAMLHNLKDRPTAIVCSADTIAMVVLRVARSLELNLPADMSVVGYGNTGFSAFTDPQLTTIAQPLEEMGRAAALHLIGYAERSEPIAIETPVEEILLPTSLVERASTAPPRTKQEKLAKTAL